jgi:hypothetical protein
MSERKPYWPFFLTDCDLCFCSHSADVMPITKIHFVGKAREGLWITASPVFSSATTTNWRSRMSISRTNPVAGTKVTEQRRGAADRGEHRHAAGAIAEGVAKHKNRTAGANLPTGMGNNGTATAGELPLLAEPHMMSKLYAGFLVIASLFAMAALGNADLNPDHGPQ